MKDTNDNVRNNIEEALRAENSISICTVNNMGGRGGGEKIIVDKERKSLRKMSRDKAVRKVTLTIDLTKFQAIPFLTNYTKYISNAFSITEYLERAKMHPSS